MSYDMRYDMWGKIWYDMLYGMWVYLVGKRKPWAEKRTESEALGEEGGAGGAATAPRGGGVAHPGQGEGV